jgi:hypothetical protein
MTTAVVPSPRSLSVLVVHPARRLDPGEPLGQDDLGEGGDHPVAAELAEHQGLEAAAGVEFDDDAVDRGDHAARTPEMRELGGSARHRHTSSRGARKTRR